VVKVDQNVDDAALGQQLDPVIQKRPTVYFDETLGDRIRYRTQTHAKPGGKKQRAQFSSLHEVVTLVDLDDQLFRP
jgi:hypothetical protein